MKSQTMNSLKSLVSKQSFQPQTGSEQESQPNMDSKAADWVWLQMVEIYGETWSRENGEEPSKLWIAKLNTMSMTEIKHAVAKVVNDGVTWPPSLPKFVSLAYGIDTDEAFDRMIKQVKVDCPVEIATRRKCSYECRTQLPEQKARALFNSVYIKFHDKHKKGELIIRPALPQTVAEQQNKEALRDYESNVKKGGYESFKAFRARFNTTKG